MFKGPDVAVGVAARNIVDGSRITEDDLQFIERHCTVTVPEENGGSVCCCRDLKAYICLTIFLVLLGLIIYYYAI